LWTELSSSQHVQSEIPLDDGQAHTHTVNANSPPPCQYQDLVSIPFTLLLMDCVTLCERLFAASENVSVKLNTVCQCCFQLKTFVQSKPIHFSMLIRVLKWEKIMGHETFSIDKNMRLTVINLLTLMRLIKIKYFNRLTAYIYIQHYSWKKSLCECWFVEVFIQSQSKEKHLHWLHSAYKWLTYT